MRLDARCTMELDVSEGAVVGRARWGWGAPSDEALSMVLRAVEFLTAWAAAAAFSPQIRSWTTSGSKRRLRQKCVDLATWWRACLYTVCGHFAGLIHLRLGAQGLLHASVQHFSDRFFN